MFYVVIQTVKDVYCVSNKRMFSMIQSTLKATQNIRIFHLQYLSPVAFSFVYENEFQRTIHSATVTHYAMDIECCV